MNEIEFTNEDVKQLTLLAAKMMLNANKHKKSMAQIEIDPQKIFDLPLKDGAGKILIVIAGGPSVKELEKAIQLAQNPH